MTVSPTARLGRGGRLPVRPRPPLHEPPAAVGESRSAGYLPDVAELL